MCLDISVILGTFESKKTLIFTVQIHHIASTDGAAMVDIGQYADPSSLISQGKVARKVSPFLKLRDKLRSMSTTHAYVVKVHRVECNATCTVHCLDIL